MRIETLFPALATARPPRHRTTKLCLAAIPMTFDLPQPTEGEAPVALRVRSAARPETPREYRLFDGRLFRSMHGDRASFVSSVTRNALMPALSVFEESWRRMKSGPGGDRFSGAACWPERLSSYIRNGLAQGTDDYALVVSGSAGLLADAQGESEIAAYRALAEAALTRYIVIDGGIWVEAREPVYSVDLAFRRVHVADGGLYDMGRSERRAERLGPGAGGRWASLRLLNFSVGDPERVADAYPAEAAVWDETVEVLLPEALRLDVESLEADRLARVLLDRIGERHRQLSLSEASVVPSTRFLRALAALRDRLPDDPFSERSEDIPALLADLMDAGRSGFEQDRQLVEGFEEPRLADFIGSLAARSISLDFEGLGPVGPSGAMR